VQVEDVAGVGFTAGGAAQNQGYLTVGDGVFGEVVIDNQRVLPLIHEVFTHGTAGVGGEVLHGGAVGGGGTHDDGVLHGAGFFEFGDESGDVRALLTDGDVDAVERTVTGHGALLGEFVLLGLGDDGVQRDGGLAGGTVTDNELTLAAANRDHGIDGQNAGLYRLVYALAGDDARGNLFHGVEVRGFNGAFAVQGVAQCIYDTSEQGGPYRYLEQAACCLAGVSFFQPQGVADDHGADFVLFEVHGKPHHPAGEFYHFVEHGVAQTFYACDAITNGFHGADVFADGCRGDVADLCFEFLYDIAHTRDRLLTWLKRGGCVLKNGVDPGMPEPGRMC